MRFHKRGEGTVIQPSISVIIPIYRTEAYLGHCLDSVLSQDFDGLEVILCASEGGDGSLDICRERARADARIRLLEIPPEGLSAARNAGLDAARGDYLSFVDSDDYLLPGMYSRLHRFAEEESLDIAISAAYRCKDGETPREYWAKGRETILRADIHPRRNFFLAWNIIGRNAAVWNKLYRRDFVEGLGLRFRRGTISEDSLFHCACFGAAGAAGAVGEGYYVYMDHSDSLFYAVNEEKTIAHTKAYWLLLQQVTRDCADRAVILAYSSVRLLAAALYNLRQAGYPVAEVCRFVYNLIEEMGFRPYLERAADEKSFSAFADTFGLIGREAEDYLGFIRSLCGGLEELTAWQRRK